MPQFGPARLAKLGCWFPSWQHAYQASQGDLVAAGLEPSLAAAFALHREKTDLEREERLLDSLGISLLVAADPAYPALLKEIDKPPPLLYVRGIMNDSQELYLAIVGTRMITSYGRLATPRLAEPLAAAGATIVSGMAFGVDALAHQSALTQGRRTVAVLAGGVDERSVYPKAHALLAEQIIAGGGALLSEYPPGTPNYKQHFLARNRIISGLSAATLVVECDLKSGSLITAKYALEQNRSVYAVPGPIHSPQSQGPNNLIKMGARPATSAADILNDLNLAELPQQRQAQEQFADSAPEAAVLRQLSGQPMHVNEIVKSSGLEAAEVASALTFLEMKGKIRSIGGQQYCLSR